MYKTLCIIVVLPRIILTETVIDDWFERINQEVVEHNQIAAKLTWESTINPRNEKLPEVAAIFQANRVAWQHRTCDGLGAISPHFLNSTQMRQTYLLCRGPRYTVLEARQITQLYDKHRAIYDTTKICIASPEQVNKTILSDIEKAIDVYSSKETFENDNRRNSELLSTICFDSDQEVEILMKKSKNKNVLEWIWTTWRNQIGMPTKQPFQELVQIENYASRRNGYSNIGSSWRGELEIPDLRNFCRELYSEIQPLYELLHGIARFYIRRHYGNSVPEKGPIPAHLMGSLWGDNWASLVDLVVKNNLDFDDRIKELKWSVKDMVKKAEDFYQSIGFPQLPKEFWQKSVFARKNNDTRCHGTAADMFMDNDFRLLYCSGNTLDDFNVIHHELGHIYYFMAYQHQPGLFRQGANSAFHESIGEAAMLGVTSPPHLHRHRLIDDVKLFQMMRNDVTGSDDAGLGLGDILLLRKAFTHIPQIPFALMLEEFRWKVFEGSIDEEDYNKVFVEMMIEVQGLQPPALRDDGRYFDAGAKFHVSDNTPYIRYFLAGILRYQLFEAVCAAGAGPVPAQRAPPAAPLHTCDVYGARGAGSLLKDIMSRGASQHWRDILYETIGQRNIQTDSLTRFYQPLRDVLNKLVKKNNIPLGW